MSPIRPKHHRVAVIGGGLGGMSAAALLAKAGYQVDLYEQLNQCGGKAASQSLGDYRFDTGPSLFTMPAVFEGFFKALGEQMTDYLALSPLEPLCNYFWRDGSRLSSSTDKAIFTANIQKSKLGTARELTNYFAKAAKIWNIAGDLFLRHSLQSPSTYLNFKAIQSIFASPSIQPFATLHGANQKAFKDWRLVQLFDRYATYNGSNPYQTPATMRIVPHVEYAWGAYSVKGGIIAVAKAVEAAAIRAGVRLHCGQKVERIFLAGSKVDAIQVLGERIPYDICISNADVLSSYSQLLDQSNAKEAKKYRRLEPSSSGLVFLWGVKKQFAALDSHNIFFSKDYREEFSAIFNGQGIGPDPTIYINITSRTNAGDAPSGCDNWFVLVNTSHNAGQDWTAIAEIARKKIVERLSADLNCDLADLIEVERVISPVTIEAETGTSYGSLYGISSNNPLAAFFRHSNRSRRIKGLYFCGASVHPGGGMPLAILSGTITAELVGKHEN